MYRNFTKITLNCVAPEIRTELSRCISSQSEKHLCAGYVVVVFSLTILRFFIVTAMQGVRSAVVDPLATFVSVAGSRLMKICMH